jgi:fructoselysine 6-kinase
MRVIGIGDNTVDIYLHLGKMFPGGNAVNVPVFVQRYGHEGTYIGALGHDNYGKLILDALKQEGVDTSHCRIVDAPNAYCEVTILDGERIFGDFSVGVRDQLALTGTDLSLINKHDLTHTSIYSAIETQLKTIRYVSSLLSFDFSQDWDKSYLEEILPFVDIAILSYPNPNRKEVEDLIFWTKSQGPQMVLLTQGKTGAYAYEGTHLFHQPPIQTEVVDTLGAGDAFAARFMVECIEGTPIDIALEKAAQSAAETCRYYGAFGHGVPIEKQNPRSI